MAKLFKIDGRVINVEPNNGTDFSYEELKSYIGGGYIECVPTNTGEYIICDEEGKLKDFEINWKASEAYGSCLNLGDFLVGDILIIGQDQIK